MSCLILRFLRNRVLCFHINTFFTHKHIYYYYYSIIVNIIIIIVIIIIVTHLKVLYTSFQSTIYVQKWNVFFFFFCFFCCCFFFFFFFFFFFLFCLFVFLCFFFFFFFFFVVVVVVFVFFFVFVLLFFCFIFVVVFMGFCFLLLLFFFFFFFFFFVLQNCFEWAELAYACAAIAYMTVYLKMNLVMFCYRNHVTRTAIPKCAHARSEQTVYKQRRQAFLWPRQYDKARFIVIEI